eukprot:COSAG04_NODE_224_length_19624_cov_47.932855_6_plen_236_part_00
MKQTDRCIGPRNNLRKRANRVSCRSSCGRRPGRPRQNATCPSSGCPRDRASQSPPRENTTFRSKLAMLSREDTWRRQCNVPCRVAVLALRACPPPLAPLRSAPLAPLAPPPCNQTPKTTLVSKHLRAKSLHDLSEMSGQDARQACWSCQRRGGEVSLGAYSRRSRAVSASPLSSSLPPYWPEAKALAAEITFTAVCIQHHTSHRVKAKRLEKTWDFKHHQINLRIACRGFRGDAP